MLIVKAPTPRIPMISYEALTRYIIPFSCHRRRATKTYLQPEETPRNRSEEVQGPQPPETRHNMHLTSTPSRLLICLFVLPWAMAAVLDTNLDSASSDVMQENTVFQTNADICDETTDTCKTQNSPAGAACKIECVRSLFCLTFILKFLHRVEERLTLGT
ncbi:unnamed protein product [Cercospora beticola]|nr:unnamed protein product [Cercospora beticola]